MTQSLEDLEKAAAKAEEKVPEGQVGEVVRQLRYRAHKSARRADQLWWALLLTIVAGFVYYIGLPLYQKAQDANRDAAELSIGVYQSLISTMDQQRQSLVDELRAAIVAIEVPTRANVPYLDVEIIGDTSNAVLAGDFGSLQYSSDGGRTWEFSDNPDPNRDFYKLTTSDGEQMLYAYGLYQDVDIFDSTIFRSVDQGKTWTLVYNDVAPINNRLQDQSQFQNKGRIVAVGRGGRIVWSDDGVNWVKVDEQPIPEDLLRVTHLDDALSLVAIGRNGALIHSQDGGLTWELGPELVPTGLYDLQYVPDAKKLIVIGADETILRLDKVSEWDHSAWKIVRHNEDSFDYYDIELFPNSKALVVSGEGGNIAIAPEAGLDWETPETNSSKSLEDIQIISEDSALVVGDGGAVLRSDDQGKTWTIADTGTRTDLYALDVNRTLDTAIIVGSFGKIIRYAKSNQDLLPTRFAAGSRGDAELNSALNTLPKEITKDPAISAHLQRLERLDLSEARNEAEQDLKSAQETFDQLRATGVSIAQKREAFEAFMKSCRGVNQNGNPVLPPDKDSTVACAEAYAAKEEAEKPDWWATLSEYGPPAILLLFLLGTFNGLYRYNMRLEGFHHSRADALVMMADKGLSLEELSVFAECLAADKVQFGKGNTPSDQAVELFRVLAGRAKPGGD